MKIVFMIRDAFYDADPKLIEETKLLGEVRVLYPDQGIAREDLLQEVSDADIIVVAKEKIDQEVIDAAPKLKYIIKHGAGYDNIDVSFAYQKGIAVTYAPGQNAESVADNVFGLMLAAARNIPKKDKEMKGNYWELSMGHEIFQKRLGIIGFGSIGKAVARRATGFNMEVIAFGNYLDHEAAKKLNVQFVALEELLRSSDYIVLSTALTDKNKELINKDTIALMKRTAYLINVSRGGLIKEDDLIEALQSNRIKGAGLDVFSLEPPINHLPLLENVVATPHIGAATYESLIRMRKVTIENIKRIIAGEELLYQVFPKEEVCK